MSATLTAAEVAAELAKHRKFCAMLSLRYACRLGRTSDQQLREELYCAAVAGLWEGLTRFDPTRGVKPLTFCGWYCMKAIAERLEDDWPMFGPKRRTRQAEQEANPPRVRVCHDPATNEQPEDEWLSDLAGRPEAEPPADIPADFWGRVERSLTKAEWLAVRLVYRDGRGTDEAAAVLGRSRAMLQLYLQRARRRLKGNLWLRALAS